ncbi:hypothetical protein BGW80DRAFT_1256287 [Lactifluus volemus]|nr:hypothetical protein BGW80DRAFT_1256287 [Lactifluus volemus]
MVILETTALLFHPDSTSQDELLVFLKDLPKPESGQNPPHIFEWHDKEKSLLRHDPDLSYPQGREGLGWGNAMQEMDYTWDKTSPITMASRFLRVPLTALLSGRVAGDPFPPSVDAPPVVVPEFFYEVCPNRTIIDSTEINGGLSEPSAATTLQVWIDKLEKIEDRCVEIKEHQGRSLIYGLLALHIRRGDYREHCKDTGLQRVPQITGPVPPAAHSRGNAPPEELARYRARCFPEIDQIVSCVRDVRASLLPMTTLRRAYVLTNGRPEWLQELKHVLQEDAQRQGMDEWEHIGTSRDLRLAREQRHNFQVVDMAIAQRSEVFLGNGFSSLTSNVVMLRAAQGMDWNKTRFW